MEVTPIPTPTLTLTHPAGQHLILRCQNLTMKYIAQQCQMCNSVSRVSARCQTLLIPWYLVVSLRPPPLKEGDVTPTPDSKQREHVQRHESGGSFSTNDPIGAACAAVGVPDEVLADDKFLSGIRAGVRVLVSGRVSAARQCARDRVRPSQKQWAEKVMKHLAAHRQEGRQWVQFSPEALSNIERGVTRQLPHETLERLLDALHQVAPLPLRTRNAVREAAGYRPRFPLPSADDIAWARQQWQQETEGLPYPAYLVDCAQRVLAWNDLALRLIGLHPTDPAVAQFQDSTIFDLACNPTYRATAQIANPETFLPQMVRVLKAEFQTYQHEPWLADCLEPALQRYPALRVLWETVPVPVLPLGQRTMGPLHCRLPGGQVLCFQLLGAEFVSDPRFRGVQYLPADTTTLQQCLQWAEAADEPG